MLSNDHSNSPQRHYQNKNSRAFKSDRIYQSTSEKPHVQEDTIKTERIQIERKTFIFTLKENPRGRFLRITEDVNGRRDNIIIPSTGLEDFSRIVSEMAQVAGQKPSQAA